MLPPAFIDFALSRDLADGVMLTGCSEGNCYYRLGNEWTQDRVTRVRDPHLRKRVPRERIALSWMPKGARRRRQALDNFMAQIKDLPPMKKRRVDRE